MAVKVHGVSFGYGLQREQGTQRVQKQAQQGEGDTDSQGGIEEGFAVHAVTALFS